MGRAHCCCLGTDPDEPDTPNRACNRLSGYTLQSITEDYNNDCIFRDDVNGFFGTDRCRDPTPDLDNADTPVVDNYEGTECAPIKDPAGRRVTQFGGDSQGNQYIAYIDVPNGTLEANSLDITYECKFGFERITRLDVDGAGWFVTGNGAAPYSEPFCTVTTSSIVVVIEHEDDNGSKSLPLANAYYKTTVTIRDPSPVPTIYQQWVFNTPVSAFYNTLDQTRVRIEQVSAPVRLLPPLFYQYTANVTVLTGGTLNTANGLNIGLFGSTYPCNHNHKTVQRNGKSGAKLVGPSLPAGDPLHSKINRVITLPQARTLAPDHPNVAWCFEKQDDYYFGPT